jgi:E3 ubiquitin-protein ligase BRE1
MVLALHHSSESLRVLILDLIDIFDLTLYISEESVPELRTAMERTISSTREILTRISQLGTQSGLQVETYQQHQTVQTEVSLK